MNKKSRMPPEKSRRDSQNFWQACFRTRIPYIFAATNDENMCKIQVKDGQFPGIYKITEKNTGKVYIGQTSRSINERLTQRVFVNLLPANDYRRWHKAIPIKPLSSHHQSIK